MYANYHTHTYLCNHARGEMEDYVLEAIKNGLKILGFSDHSPLPFSNGFDGSYHRMKPEETQIYVEKLLEMKEKYKEQIEILIGYEAEYYPDEFENLINHIEKYHYDYLILGQHFTNNEYDGVYCAAPCDEEQFLKYVNQVIEGIGTKKFLYIAHPDVVCYNDDIELYKSEMLKLCQAAKEADMPLEFNLLGLVDGRHYPQKEFWEIAAEAGNKVIMGCDAHEARYVGNSEVEEKALALMKEYNIKPIKKLEL